MLMYACFGSTAYVLSSTLDGRDHLAQSVKALQRIQQSQPALVRLHILALASLGP